MKKTPRDCRRVFEAMDHPDLGLPSRIELAELISVAETMGRCSPTTLAWIFTMALGREEAAELIDSVRQDAEDSGLIDVQGVGAVVGVLCGRDLDAIAEADLDAWKHPDEIVGEDSGAAPKFLLATAAARRARDEDAQKWDPIIRKLRQVIIEASPEWKAGKGKTN